MEMTVDQQGDSIRIELRGDIDELGANKLKTGFNELDLSNCKQIVFDFGGVNYIGSAGIGKMLIFYKAIASKGGRLAIENANKAVYDLLKVVKLDTIFTITSA